MEYSYLMPVRDDPDKIDQLCSCFKIFPGPLRSREGMVWQRTLSSWMKWGYLISLLLTYPLKIKPCHLNDHHHKNICFIERLQAVLMARLMVWVAFSHHYKQTWISSISWLHKPFLSFSLSSFSATFSALAPLMGTYSVGRCHQPKPSTISGLGLPHSLLSTHLSAVKALLQID